MIYFGASILVIGFILCMKLFGLVEKANKVLILSQDSMAVLRNTDMEDAAKETAMQTNALKLFGLFFTLTLGCAAALGLPIALVWLLSLADIMPFDSVIIFTLSWKFLLASTLLISLAMLLGGKRKSRHDFEVRYSFTDRILHYIAFNTTLAQLSLADMEDSLFRKQLEESNNKKPVFITGLPRGGTTLVLDMCHRLNEFASHRYRDMPFLLIPMLWNKFSKRFQKADEKRERAHGDGMMVSADSPEALEEIIWKSFWKKQYAPDRIVPWNLESNTLFDEFFMRHMTKISALKQSVTGVQARYVSKNNLNISRVGYLLKTFPDGVIIVPYMHPLRHAEDLLRQHKNFLDIHKDDSFAGKYMEGVGHYDFGDNIRPIDFNSWLDRRKYRDYEDMNFWLEYWITAYQHLLEKVGERVFLHSHEALCVNTRASLEKLADIIGIEDKATFMKNEETIWKTVPPEVSTEGLDPHLVTQAEDLYLRMRARSHTQ